MTKMVIVMRKDLNMRRGKQIAQSCHASLAILTNMLSESGGNWTIDIPTVMEEWLKDSFTKICVYVNSEKELFDIYDKAKANDILCSIIQDAGRTEFNGVPTYTCCAIGPDYSDKINEITGKLPLL